MSGGYSNSSDDETEAGKQKWISETLDIRRQALDLLNECSHPGIDNFQTVRVPDVVRALHAATLSYAEQVRPKHRKLGDVSWDVNVVQEALGRSIHVPKDKFEEVEKDGEKYKVRVGYEVGSVDRYGEVEVDDVLTVADTEPWEVNPDTLGLRWRAGNQVRLTARIDDGAETITEQRTFAVYLPPAACSVLITHFDDCLNDLDWLPGGVKEVEGTVTPDGEIEIVSR